ncbi:hypothetical protein ACFLZ9_01110 [Patescibacteria group bacterium]
MCARSDPELAEGEGEWTEQNCGAIRTTLCKMLASTTDPPAGGEGVGVHFA